MSEKKGFSGFLFGLLSSCTFGLIPLFSIPLMNGGMHFSSVLVYRFVLAALMLLPVLLKERKSLRITLGEGLRLMILALLYNMSALFLFWGYTYMASGIATTLHFMYPVMTALIMLFFFHEKASVQTFVAIALAISGVVFLMLGKENNLSIPVTGLCIVLISALGYAVYLVVVNRFKVRKMGSLKLTFYVFVFSIPGLMAYALTVGGGIQPIADLSTLTSLLLLALLPTVVSNMALINAVKRLGSTLTSVMGALEPLTAVAVGVLFLGEPFTATGGIGIALIVAAVTLLVLKK